MKIGIIGDTHGGLTQHKSIKSMLKDLKEEDPDIIVHCGDYCGGTIGYKKVRSGVKLIREIFPDIPVLSVIGNHDYWTQGKRFSGSTLRRNPTQLVFKSNYEKIIKCFKKYNIHFFEEEGYIQIENVMFIGNGMWYNHISPPTNDKKFLPQFIDGFSPHEYLFGKTYNQLLNQLEQLDKMELTHETVIMVSHFPVFNDYCDTGFETFCGNEGVGETLKRFYEVKYFIDGHTHKRTITGLRRNCGSDYYNPQYLILEI